MFESDALREDRAFFQEFYGQYHRFLFYSASRLSHDPTQVEDLVQDAVVRLLHNIPTLRTLNDAKTATYLSTTVKSVYIDHCRSRCSGERPLESASLEALGARTDPMDYTAKWDTQILQTHLSEKEWYLLEARYITGSSDKEIASVLGCAPDSIRAMLSRARRRAKAILADKQERGLSHV